MSIKIGDILTVDITDLSRGGSGIAKTKDGHTIFVPYTLTGDVVKIEIVELRRRHASAQIVDMVLSSPDRQSPRCNVFTQCGGCQWQHVPYSTQWETKINGIYQSLTAAKIDNKLRINEFPADTIWNYRNRIQMRGKGSQLGFYAARSHDIISVNNCAIARPEINQAIIEIRNQGSEHDKEYKVEIEINENGTVASYWNSHHAAGGFRQVNDEQNKKLIHWIQQSLNNNHPVYDLYGGSANLSRDIASQGIEVHCVDQSSPQDLPGQPGTLHFHSLDVLSWLKQRITDLMYKRIPEPNSPWTAIIDPPRGGMGEDFEDIVSRLEKLRVENIILIGCKTDTWSRDISKLQQRKWQVKSIAAFDFFPHTPHVETAAFLSSTADM